MKTPKPIAQKPILHHATVKETRLQEMVDWCDPVVGCAPNFTFEGAAWTKNDTANHCIAFMTRPGLTTDPNKIAHDGIQHTTFKFGTLQGLLDNYEPLAGVDILPHISLDHGMSRAGDFLPETPGDLHVPV